MRTMLVVLLALTLTAGLAVAEKPVFKKGDPVLSRGLLDCSGAVSIACGDLVSGDTTGGSDVVDAYSPVGYSHEYGPEVVYELVVTGGAEDLFEITGTISNFSPVDLDIYILGSCEETDALAYGNTTFTTDCVGPGTYYVVVDGYNDDDFGPFDLEVTCEECVPPPPPPSPLPGGETCAEAVDLQAAGLQAFSLDMCNYVHDYSAASCTYYSSSGPDAVYSIYLEEGENFAACASPPDDGYSPDLQIYVVTDCADADGTCVAGDDGGNPECVDFNAPAAGTYYLIIDTWLSCGNGTTYVTIGAPVGNEDSSWGAVKSLYR